MIAIVGAGACGLVAALTLRDAGVDCAVLERDALPSGSTALSFGFVPACGTRWQREIGVEDSVQVFFDDVQKKNGNQANPDVVRAAVAAAGPALEWLADRHGIPFHVIEGFLYPGHSVVRMHAVPERTGAALMGRLLQAADKSGVVVLTEALVVDFHPSEIRIQRPDKSTETIRCDAALLACNGFGGNREMVRRYIPEIADAEYAGHAGNQGDAVRWGEALGAKVSCMGAYQGHGAWAIPHGRLLTWALMTEGAVMVNAEGRRFLDERKEGYSEASQRVLAQPGRIAWVIYGERLHQLGLTVPDYCELNGAKAVRKASDLEGLARATGLPLKNLETELGNSAQPFYAVKVTGALFHTQGGLEVNAKAQVLKANGQPIPNLYAGGGAARGLSGEHVWGYLSGNGLLSAVALGRIAGLNLVEFASRATARPGG